MSKKNRKAHLKRMRAKASAERGIEPRYTLRGEDGLPRALYFAYGSNLHKDHMSQRCPLAEPVGRLVLPNWRLAFRGVADIEVCHRDRVEGGLFAITPQCERMLDLYEGWPTLYRKEFFLVKTGGGKVEPVLFYKMNSGGVAPPGDMYLKVIMRGFADFGLDTDKLDQAVQRAIRGKNRDVNRRDKDGAVVVDASALPRLARLAEENRS